MTELTLDGWHFRAWGAEDAPVLVLLHGFAGHGGFWEPLATELASDYRVLAPDLPGHGAGASPLPHHRLADAAEALADRLPAGAWQVAGYSLGGRLALHLAAHHPERVSALTLIGASAGLELEAERAARREQDARWSAMLRSEGLETFLTHWEAQPLFATLKSLGPEGRARLQANRQGHRPDGLADAMDCFGLGAQAPLHDVLPRLGMPTVWAAGALDTKFADLAVTLAGRMPHGRAELVPGCGHNVPLERPEAFLTLIGGLEAPQLEGVTP